MTRWTLGVAFAAVCAAAAVTGTVYVFADRFWGRLVNEAVQRSSRL